MNITSLRFFTYANDDQQELDIVEVTEAQFLAINGTVSYERHTVFNNGVSQVCLTVSPVDFYPNASDLELIAL